MVRACFATTLRIGAILKLLTVTTISIILGIFSAPSSQAATPVLDAIHRNVGYTNTARTAKCIPRLDYHWYADDPLHVSARPRILAQWQYLTFKARQVLEVRCLPPWTVWARQPGPRCVSGKEGGLTSVNPAGPYYGKWQADAAFASTYNPAAWARWGPPIYWPESEQDRMAYNGHSHRGWSPWPNTARQCGLL